MIVINQETCVGCGACVKDCPGSAIHLDEGIAAAIRPCIQCGHCVAVCPVNAVSIPEFDMEDVEEYREGEFSVSGEHFLRAVKYRRSIRSFKKEIPDRETIGAGQGEGYILFQYTCISGHCFGKSSGWRPCSCQYREYGRYTGPGSALQRLYDACY